MILRRAVSVLWAGMEAGHQLSPNRMMMQRRMAIRAPVLRPTGRNMASALQLSREPSDSQPHTRTVKVPVLLLGG